MGARIHIHVKDRRMQHLGQGPDAGAAEEMVDIDLHRLRLCQTAHIRPVHLPVAGDIQPQAPQGVDGDALFGRPARIIRVLDKAPLAGDDLACQFSH